MAKIMLVEDDNNLREIYEARLIAEGYEIVSAKDGEEALALAVKEKPDLIISDVMMPKISGFDMLDILRTTPETKNTKIIMMTALSQAEDKSRADKLGADRYLVKSQVTLEDVAAVAREVLTGEPATGTGAAAPVISTTPDPITTPAPEPVATTVVPEPVQPTTQPSSPIVDNAAVPPPTTPTPEPTQDDIAKSTEEQSVVPNVEPELSQTTADESKAIDEQINNFVANAPSTEPPEEPKPAPQPAPAPAAEPSEPLAEINVAQAPPDSTAAAADNAAKLADAVNDLLQKPGDPATTPEPTATDSTPESDSSTTAKKVIQPLNDVSTSTPDLNALLQKEELREAALSGTAVVSSDPEPAAANPIAITSDGEIKSPDSPTPTPEATTAPAMPTSEASVPVTEAPAPTDPNSPNNIAL